MHCNIWPPSFAYIYILYTCFTYQHLFSVCHWHHNNANSWLANRGYPIITHVCTYRSLKGAIENRLFISIDQQESWKYWKSVLFAQETLTMLWKSILKLMRSVRTIRIMRSEWTCRLKSRLVCGCRALMLTCMVAVGLTVERIRHWFRSMSVSLKNSPTGSRTRCTTGHRAQLLLSSLSLLIPYSRKDIL